MGNYLNPSAADFQESLNSKIYVDKTGLIAKTNEVVSTKQKYLCVSRPRRFGKSMAMDMLAAYYAYGADSHALFDGLKISSDSSYEAHINRYNVLKVNMQEFLSLTHNVEKMLQMLTRYLIMDIQDAYPEVRFRDEENFN